MVADGIIYTELHINAEVFPWITTLDIIVHTDSWAVHAALKSISYWPLYEDDT